MVLQFSQRHIYVGLYNFSNGILTGNLVEERGNEIEYLRPPPRWHSDIGYRRGVMGELVVGLVTHQAEYSPDFLSNCMQRRNAVTPSILL